MELQWIGRSAPAAQFAVGAIDLGGGARIAAFAVRMVLFDEPLVRLLDSRRVGTGREPQNSERKRGRLWTVGLVHSSRT